MIGLSDKKGGIPYKRGWITPVLY